MDNSKPVQFEASAGSYFILTIVTAISMYIPFFGWAYGFNYAADWATKNSKINGKDVSYHAEYGETLKFVSINALLVIITLGIYTFWFTPKAYKYAANHVSYGSAPTPAAAPAPAAPIEPTPASPVQ